MNDVDTKEELREDKILDDLKETIKSWDWFMKANKILEYNLEEKFLNNLAGLSGLWPYNYKGVLQSIEIFSENITTTVWRDAIDKTINDNIQIFEGMNA